MSIGPILVVDDEPANLAILKQILGPIYRLVFARSGVECLAAAKKHQPALILLDIQMPDMDGYTVCRNIKADPMTEATPIIFVSALSEVGDEWAGFESGAVDYITKPVSPAIVRARVRTHLSLVRATTLERYVIQLELEQAKTRRLSRVHAVQSGTNSAIVRIRDVNTLIDEACRIAVAQGGFGAAWIAMTDADDNALKLAACQGVDAGSLSESLQLADSVDSVGLGIPDTVLKSGKAMFCNDVRIASDTGRTSKDAERRGFLSLVALPIFVLGKNVGIMVLYASDANHFDDAEMQLLNELAGDISFALHAIENEKRARFLSYYDALTSLPNTALFLDRVGQLIQGQGTARDGDDKDDGDGVFIIVLNLERFKQVNDTYGRHIGDQILIMVAQRLNQGISHSCTVARTGADNFAVAGVQTRGQKISALCDQVTALLSESFDIDDRSLRIAARLGIAIYPSDADNAESLFKNGEAALKQAKSTKNRYSFYSRELNARIAEKIELERMLKSALEEDQYLLYYQPKIDLATGRITGAEALIRWQHPQRGMVPPIEFIPLAEETGLIVPIGTWVIRAVCAQQASWRRQQIPIVPVALNLSSLQFREGNVLELVIASLSEFALDPSWIELELTESLVMQNPEEAEKTMRAFRKHGLSLSLDDFGTGYSSLAYLKRFPFNSVKIDRAFVNDVTNNPDDAAIAYAIIGMAHSLRMKVIAEGVETEAQLNFLRGKQCDQFQGYFFSRPVPAKEFAAMLAADKRLNFPPTMIEAM
ncbi:MAG TPA: EAL domain-containing protein [Burkholderiaceae bacterium]|jgi:diguanylate cyclase (GGDEF)-like protein|nr:EAL domain-containing protein [Burkholderiaceae bacterium]